MWRVGSGKETTRTVTTMMMMTMTITKEVESRFCQHKICEKEKKKEEASLEKMVVVGGMHAHATLRSYGQTLPPRFAVTDTTGEYNILNFLIPDSCTTWKACKGQTKRYLLNHCRFSF
jgi:cytochrome c-type biogenesis protein CcmE